MKAIILVAGYATRLYPLTKDKPKALLPINGKPIIDYIVDEINTISTIDQIYVVTNHKFAENFDQWAETVKSNIPVKIIDDGTTTEETRRGAIGDIQFTIENENIDDEMMVIAGDNFFTYKLLDYYNYYLSVNKNCVVAKELDDIGQLRQFAVATVNSGNKVIELDEKPENPKSNLAVYATYIYLKETVPLFKQYLNEGNKPDAPGYFVQWLYKNHDVHAYRMQGDCYDIGTPRMYEEVNQLFQ